jgi:cell division ATPase FtsA
VTPPPSTKESLDKSAELADLIGQRPGRFAVSVIIDAADQDDARVIVERALETVGIEVDTIVVRPMAAPRRP